ncbi:MAG: methylenetetrahydrofolate reductase [Xanthomonadales bacterium]|nr:methylenetetrahydrofolate reductase [Xanthomonadales bacterium]NIN58560.1 methylenetetrahydrofolate reductase [Xanthomonadales bacterium]NIN73849.1 methylenetetrahydrofolate reductase [Xanthomonadales bacterium]NIO12318.1 methylenetetrahydrofolate reductase [Xanthomonadales bacterium]NIP10953.1 methylenetetrahydrofolate reductase [Xanthomonadales bacterium]
MKGSPNLPRDAALEHLVREAYLEIFPTPSIERRLADLAPGSFVSVSCSPTKGVDATLDLTHRLADRGFRVVPHIAAKMVRGDGHLREIMARLEDLPVDSIFVPGGDAARPLGPFGTAWQLLQAISEYDHRFAEIGIATHPEGHPEVAADVLLAELERKQALATYLVTQMCFDVQLLGRWLRAIRARGVRLPAWIGIPGVSDRATLLKTSLRIGVGDSLRFLRRKRDAVARFLSASVYTPDALLRALAPLLHEESLDIAGCHVFSFNQVEQTEAWRRQALAVMQSPADT